MKRLLARTVLVLLSVALALVAAEALVRVTDLAGVSYYGDVRRYLREAIELSPDHARELADGRIFQNKPDVDLELRHFRYRTDAHGLRRGAADPGYDPADSADSDRTRIFFLGDSVTLGWGVDDEATWVRLVEAEGRTPTGAPIRCLNAGHLMYDTVQEASLLRAWGPRHRPDVVVLTFVFNDVQPTWDQAQALMGLTPDGTAAAGARPETGWFGRLLPRLGELLRFARERRRYAAADRSDLVPYSYYPSGWPRCERALDDVLAACGELGARLVVVDHTTQQPIPDVAAWCADRGVPWIDGRFTAEESARDIRNSPVDAHANALGNRLLADKVLAGLRATGVLGG